MEKPKKIDFKDFHECLSFTIPLQELYSDFDKFITILTEKFIKSVKDNSFNFQKIAKLIVYRNELPDIDHEVAFEKNNNQEVFGWRILLKIAGVSQEFFKNIFCEGRNISDNQILKNKTFLDNFIHILTNGANDEKIKKQFNDKIIEFNRLRLSEDLVRFYVENPLLLKVSIEDLYSGRLNQKRGTYIEDKIIGKFLKEKGINWEAGTLDFLKDYYDRMGTGTRNPKIDFIIPSKSNPKILIESSYQLTTASGQTKKIDANDAFYNAIQNYNNTKKMKLIFINFFDGAGWKARGESDVHRLWASCDYAINYETLNQLKEIIEYYLSKENFSTILSFLNED